MFIYIKKDDLINNENNLKEIKDNYWYVTEEDELVFYKSNKVHPQCNISKNVCELLLNKYEKWTNLKLKIEKIDSVFI